MGAERGGREEDSRRHCERSDIVFRRDACRRRTKSAEKLKQKTEHDSCAQHSKYLING